MRLLPIAIFALLASISPMTDEQRSILATAHDGRDHREPAFFALVEHVRTWTSGTGDASLRVDPDYEVMIEHPDQFRGDLCRLTGRIQQQTSLAAPYDIAEEWFIRNDAGRPILVYVVAPNEGPPSDRRQTFRDGARITIHARFYKRVDAVDRTGRTRRYPAFVGAFPIVVRSSTASAVWRPLWFLAIAAGILLVVFLVLLFRVRRQRRIDHPFRRPGSDLTDALDEGSPLPDDPAEALTELRRRAEPDA
jgi:hypothetical protein